MSPQHLDNHSQSHDSEQLLHIKNLFDLIRVMQTGYNNPDNHHTRNRNNPPLQSIHQHREKSRPIVQSLYSNLIYSFIAFFLQRKNFYSNNSKYTIIYSFLWHYHTIMQWEIIGAFLIYDVLCHHTLLSLNHLFPI